MTLWQLGNDFVAAGREIMANAAMMSSGNSTISANRNFFFVIVNGPGVRVAARHDCRRTPTDSCSVFYSPGGHRMGAQDLCPNGQDFPVHTRCVRLPVHTPALLTLTLLTAVPVPLPVHTRCSSNPLPASPLCPPYRRCTLHTRRCWTSW